MTAESLRQSREICLIPASKLHGMDFWCSCPAWLCGEVYGRETSVSAAGFRRDDPKTSASTAASRRGQASALLSVVAE